LIVLAFLFFFPESEVFFQKFDDALCVTEVVFLELVNLVEGILECSVSELTGGFVVLHHFVVEYREIESKTQFDGVAWWESNLICLVVCLKSILLNLLKKTILSVLSDVAIVVTNHLNEKGL